jgi:hypothetical protein
MTFSGNLGDKGDKTMVKSNICPVCLADIPGEYIEEGDLRITDEPITCPNCGFTLEGIIDECPEFDDLSILPLYPPLKGQNNMP